MPRSFTFATIAEYQAAKSSENGGGAIYAALVSSGIKSGSVVSKITATGDVFIDSINPFVTPDLGQEGDTLYYSSTEGYRFLRAGNSAWDADSLGQVYIDLAKIPSGFSKVEPFVDEFVYKRTTEDIGSGKASMTKILGKSLAWNNPVQNGDFTSVTWWIKYKASYTVSNNVATIVGSEVGGCIYRDVPFVVGHKYYISASAKSDGTNQFSVRCEGAIVDVIVGTTSSSFTFGSKVKTASSWNYFRIAAGCPNAAATGYLQKVQVVDLTLLYGSAIDGMTDAQILAKFESEFPGYHSYNAGTLLSNKAKAIEFVGFNQWDEEWVNGFMNDNGTIGSGARIISKNFIPVISGQSYYFNYGDHSNFFNCFYDADKNNVTQRTAMASPIVTAPSGASYMKFMTNSDYLSNYNHDICINLSGKRNGQYEPYKKVVLPLPNLDQIKVYSHNIWDETFQATNKYIADDGTFSDSDVYNISSYIKVEPNTIYYLNNVVGPNAGLPAACWYDENKQYITGLAGASNIYNKTITSPSNARYLVCSIYKPTIGSCCINLSSSFNGQYEPHGILTMKGGLKSAGSVYDEIVGNKYIKRVGRVDLGTLEWSSYNYSSDFLTFRAGLAHAASLNAICSKYQIAPVNGAADQANKTLMTRANTGTIYVRDDDYSTAEAFKTAMQNEHVQLDYELATPIEYEIYSPTKMPFNWKYRVSEYHTKKMLPENGENPTSAPFACEIKQI